MSDIEVWEDATRAAFGDDAPEMLIGMAWDAAKRESPWSRAYEVFVSTSASWCIGTRSARRSEVGGLSPFVDRLEEP